MKKNSVFVCLFFQCALLLAQPNYKMYDTFLKKHVSSTGKVNYKAIKAQKLELNKIVADFETNTVKSTWSKNEQLAFWLNAYNLFTLKLIVDNYPITSIMKLDNGKTWDVKRIKIGSATYALNDIENKIIRPQFKDARIHFALNCAAKSCPPLRAQAFTAENVNELLESQTKKFIESSVKSTKQVEIAKIFEWYKEDFGDLIPFLNKYSTKKIDTNAKISFSEYDWSLNE